MNFSSLSTLFKSFYNNDIEEKLERPKLDEFISMDVNGENCTFKGKVTSLFNGEGTVDNLYYFSVKDINIYNLKIGDKVQGFASKSLHGAWRTITMQSIDEDWDSDCETDVIKFAPLVMESNSSIIGKVSSIYNNLICLNDRMSFLNHHDTCSFQICVGDWILCENFMSENILDNHSNLPVFDVKPLRKKTVYGVVSQICSIYYIINEEIYCDKNIISTRLKLRDRIIVDVIESDRGRFSWRAIEGKLDPSMELSQPCLIDLSFLLKDTENTFRRKNEIFNDAIQVSKDDFSLKQNLIYITNDIQVSVEVDMTEFIIIDIQNKDDITIWLENVIISEAESQLSIDKYFINKSPHNITPKQHLKVFLECKGWKVGQSTEKCVFYFRDCTIERNISITVKERVTAVNNYKNKLIDTLLKGRIVKGEKPFHSAPFIPIKLPYAEVPEKLRNMVREKVDLSEEFSCLKQAIDVHNYVEKFSTLLFLEEIEMEHQISKYDMPCASFERHGNYLALVVNGLSEKRPSLLVGDSVVVSNMFNNGLRDDIRFEGCIHEVLHNKVLLKFHPDFHSQYADEDYSVQLCCNRTPLRRCHLAISLAIKQLGGSILFPKVLNYQLPQACYVEDTFQMQPTIKTSIPKLVSVPETHTSTISLEKNETNFKSKVPNVKKVKISNKTGYKADKNGYCAPVITWSNNKVNGAPYLKWLNETLNIEQKLAVKRILEGTTRPLPYVIYGPPGTGKTVTIVEAILQVYLLIPHSRILVVTPSNSASDLVAERTILSGGLKRGDLIRIYSFNRSNDCIPKSLSEFVDKNCSIDVVVRHRIIVSTVTNSGILYTAKLKNGHFTHVFIDEAGQLTEPETCISLGLVNSCSGQIVLAGDPKQLGPIVLSSLAKRFGLGKSLLHRLCSSVLYQPQNVCLMNMYTSDDTNNNELSSASEKLEKSSTDKVTFEPRLVTLLVRNYRSHADFLNVPSKLFYHSNLISCAPLEVQNCLLSWPELPSKSIPLLFHSVKGQNQQEGDSPSWFNAAEAFQVCRYTNSLVKFGINPVDIGIITPYTKQVEKIRKLLSAFEIVNVKVGPVEEFQGQERVAIILSTVRSNENLIEDDLRHSLGFLQAAERFNVAITRAKSLFVVVGNPFLLKEDPYWSEFLSFCCSKGVIR